MLRLGSGQAKSTRASARVKCTKGEEAVGRSERTGRRPDRIKTVELPPVTAKGRTGSRKDQRAASIGGGREGQDSKRSRTPIATSSTKVTAHRVERRGTQTLLKPRSLCPPVS